MRKMLSALLFSAAAASSAAATLEIEVSGLRSADGMVLLAIYDSAEGWMKKPLRGAVVQAGAEGRALLRIENLPDGDYAFSLLHDANGNRRMDSNALGMPIEAYGFSNNAAGSFGPPSFEAARFTLKGDGLQRVQLN